MTTVPHFYTGHNRSVSAFNISRLLDNLLENYDNMLRPDFGGNITIWNFYLFTLFDIYFFAILS